MNMRKRIEKVERERPLINAAVLTAGLAIVGCGGESTTPCQEGNTTINNYYYGSAGSAAQGSSSTSTGGSPGSGGHAETAGQAGSVQTGTGGATSQGGSSGAAGQRAGAGGQNEGGFAGEAGSVQAGNGGQAGAGGETTACEAIPCRSADDISIVDPDAGNSYVESQDVWTTGQGDLDGHLLLGEYETYSITFSGPGSLENGVPVCTEHVSGDFTACMNGSMDDATETHRVQVFALGEQWIISEMNAPYELVPTEETLVAGGSIKLAKEAINGILNQGEQLEVNGFKFQLDDLEAHGDVTAAIISVLDVNDNIIERERVDPGETQQINIGGETYRFHVYTVAPGYTFGAKWADVAIFADEIELVNGQELNASQGNYPGVSVSLYWTNRDLTTANTDSLRQIVLHNQVVCSERSTCE